MYSDLYPWKTQFFYIYSDSRIAFMELSKCRHDPNVDLMVFYLGING